MKQFVKDAVGAVLAVWVFTMIGLLALAPMIGLGAAAVYFFR